MPWVLVCSNGGSWDLEGEGGAAIPLVLPASRSPSFYFQLLPLCPLSSYLVAPTQPCNSESRVEEELGKRIFSPCDSSIHLKLQPRCLPSRFPS